MRTKLTLDDLRLRLNIRLAVANRSWFKQLWEPKARPHQRDRVRDDLVDFITEGWEALEIEASAPKGPSGHIPPARTDES